jgi:hypothetical protein
MQFDSDSNGKFSDIFYKLREIILGFNEIYEKKNAKQTAYYDEYSAVCFLRSNEEKLTLALAKGSSLQKRYPFLEGEGKIVRHLYFRTISEVNENLIREMIQETLILNMEAYELKKLKKLL